MTFLQQQYEKLSDEEKMSSSRHPNIYYMGELMCSGDTK
jgi:hypothetical protein